VICGAKGENKIPDGCWYQLVENTLTDKCVSEPADDGDGDVLRYRKGDQPEAVVQEKIAPGAIKSTSVPPWLRTDAAADTSRPRTITPSRAMGDDARPISATANAQGLLRGTLVHCLLQSLPDVAAPRRAKVAQEYLARKGNELDVEQRQKIAEQLLALLDDAQFSGLFLPGSRAEVPIVGQVEINGETIRVTGQVDRLVVTKDAVLIGDFKTGDPAPQRLKPYARQLALYRAILKKLYPDRTVRTALIWTEVPELMELSATDLDAALARVTSA
jgi:ATP-dependent helicase/nuclease subunit A